MRLCHGAPLAFLGVDSPSAVGFSDAIRGFQVVVPEQAFRRFPLLPVR